MSDAQRPENPDSTPHSGFETDVDGNPIPDPEVVAAQALPAIYNRSPRLVQVISTAIGGGFVVGAFVGMFVPIAKAWGVLMSMIVTGLAFALLGGVIAGLTVASSEVSTSRKLKRAKQEAIAEWVAANPDATFDEVMEASRDAFDASDEEPAAPQHTKTSKNTETTNEGDV